MKKQWDFDHTLVCKSCTPQCVEKFWHLISRNNSLLPVFSDRGPFVVSKIPEAGTTNFQKKLKINVR